MKDEVQIVSFGKWIMLDEGLTEARYVLGISDAGYSHAIEVSIDGGDMPGGLFWSRPAEGRAKAKAEAESALVRYIERFNGLRQLVAESKAGRA